MSKTLTTKVTGGYLVAKASEDPNYPGIEISFKPGFGGGDTGLVLLEETDHTLILRSWMDTEKEEPVSSKCRYDAVLLSQVAYGFYLTKCLKAGETPVLMQEFAETLFYQEAYMKTLLPVNLMEEYTRIMSQEESENDAAGK